LEKMRVIIIVLSMILGFAPTAYAGVAKQTPKDTLYQVSTLEALMEGVYDGEMRLDELLTHGDFGIGTFENLNGEMVVLNGVVYQVPALGEVVKAKNSVKTPFAMLTAFETDIQLKLDNVENLAEMKQQILDILPSKNNFYAIKIPGNFKYVKARSVAGQKLPYPRLADVTKDQTVFEFKDVEGTLVGYWCPEYTEGLNMAGFHLHFLSADGKKGGHLLECSLLKGAALLDITTELQVLLPRNKHFAEISLQKVAKEEKQKVEQ